MRAPRLSLFRRSRPDRFDGLVRNNRVSILHNGRACFPAMLKAIEEAQSEVLLEMYWFASDRTGWRFANALMAKVKQGVPVRIIYDAVGSLEADTEIFEEMRAAGCLVRQYNPIAPWRHRFRIGLVNNRDHRKILVVDRRIGFTGGVNIGDPWAPVEEGGGGWRDDMIRIEGPATEQLYQVFARIWGEIGEEMGQDHPELDSLRPSVIETSTPSGPDADVAEEDNCSVRVLANHYRRERAAIYQSYLAQIRGARSHIYITNSYFVPDRAVRKALSAAVSRGVRVKVLLPGESDVIAVHYAARRLYGWLLRRGIELYQWQGTILHAKTAVVDDSWATVGTYNMDYRSWRTNLEVNVAVVDPGIATAMGRRFLGDLQVSEQVQLAQWAYRPVSERLLEHFFFQFRKAL